jgi:GNAT superfamily N-acetyltransferase
VEPWIREVTVDGPDGARVLRLADELGQADRVRFSAGHHHSSHLLAPFAPEPPESREPPVSSGSPGRLDPPEPEPTGFCRYVVQPIGPDAGCPPVTFEGRVLTEANVLAFGVAPRWRRRGVGTALQRCVIAAAGAAGCRQVRSHSSGEDADDQRLKLRLGFTVHPATDDYDVRGCCSVYFLLPLG